MRSTLDSQTLAQLASVKFGNHKQQVPVSVKAPLQQHKIIVPKPQKAVSVPPVPAKRDQQNEDVKVAVEAARKLGADKVKTAQ